MSCLSSYVFVRRRQASLNVVIRIVCLLSHTEIININFYPGHCTDLRMFTVYAVKEIYRLI